jgi:hypothetical protein
MCMLQHMVEERDMGERGSKVESECWLLEMDQPAARSIGHKQSSQANNAFLGAEINGRPARERL